MQDVTLRHAEASDYQPVIEVINEWFGGRQMSGMLPRLFFIHFRETSFVAEKGGELIGFLVGFLSQTFKGEAYIHFVGVRPDFRRAGVGRMLYKRFFEVARENGCHLVRCITSPANKTSVAFHLRMGFGLESQEQEVDGRLPVCRSYDGRGGDRVLFIKRLDTGEEGADSDA